MLNGELYTQRVQELIYLCLSTDCFMKIEWREIFMKQSVENTNKLTSEIFVNPLKYNTKSVYMWVGEFINLKRTRKLGY